MATNHPDSSEAPMTLCYFVRSHCQEMMIQPVQIWTVTTRVSSPLRSNSLAFIDGIFQAKFNKKQKEKKSTEIEFDLSSNWFVNRFQSFV